MTNNPAYFILIFISAILTGCGTNSKQETTEDSIATAIKTDSLKSDTTELKEAFNEDDIPVNEYVAEKLKPIRENFKRINSIANWTTVDKKELWESTEGGEAKFYYLNGQLEKITAKHYGETYQQLTEYFLLKGQLSFVFEKTYKYNRPMYYDTAAMKENNDIEAFDFEKSKITEVRNYFDNGKLLHQLNNQDSTLSLAGDYLPEEQKRIRADFDKLIKLEATK